MSPYEIIQMINNYKFGQTTRQTIEDVNELIAEITDDPKGFVYELSQNLESFSLKNNKCPLCGENIVQIDRNSESSEYFGQEVNEVENIYGCENSSCGYIVNKD